MGSFIKFRFLAAVVVAVLGSSPATGWYLEQIHAPQGIEPSTRKAIVIAVVDDGVRASHRDLRGFIWTNPQEKPDNRVDDDGNGFVDDVHGWDISDADLDPSPPEDRLAEFHHGTHLAGIVTQLVRHAYGDRASDLVRIMPVKSLSDGASRTYVKDGYKGIEYAVRSGADVVVAAWGQDHISAAETQVLREAEQAGTLIVASAGNFSTNRPQYPAAHDSVLAVAAVDPQRRKTAISSFGAYVDLSAPGTNITGAGTRSDMELVEKEGTSQAAALVAGAAAIVKLQRPSLSAQQIVACLKQAADPIDSVNPRHVAQLGAGTLNLEAAVACDLLEEQRAQQRLSSPQGYLRFTAGRGKSTTWQIEPQAPFQGLRFSTRIKLGEAIGGSVAFYPGSFEDEEPIGRHELAELPDSVYVPGTSARVVFEPRRKSRKLDWLVEYRAEPIDFPRLYCRETLFLDEEGAFEDGSGPEDYSFHSDCKWLVTAPEGKVVHLRFTEFDTEAKTDLIYFFNGTGTHEDIMAIFSGPDIPPELTTWSNQVLVWFVSNGKNEGEGFRAEYRFVDP